MIISPALRIRAVSATLALVAGIGLLAYEPAAVPASAADTDLTDSVVTLRWSDGIVGADNSTVVEERDPESPLYDDFDGLEVTIAQTDDLRAQALDVSWSGWRQTPNPRLYDGNFMQLMQCWGDAETGPLPENCVWGAQGLDAGATINSSVGFRLLHEADPLTAAAPDKYRSPDGRLAVPFLAANGDEPQWLGYVFDRWTSNEVRAARTNASGAGETIFTVQDTLDAPYLGCGAVVEDDDDGGRDCWLVLVPRGVHHLDGTPIAGQQTPANLVSGSPLSPTAWAQRIQVRLDFAPVTAGCPADAAERQTVGSELAASAMYSWQPGLCADGASYAYIPASDAEGRRQVTLDDPAAPGLAFTYAPVVGAEGQTEILHAPLTVSGMVIAFNVEHRDGTIVRDLRLTPRLVAKMLTQSYQNDVPGLRTAEQTVEHGFPEWAASNPLDVSEDPEFRELNPDAPFANQGTEATPNILRVPGPGGADALRELWRWIQADDDAAAWLGGAPDEHGMVVNPYFEELQLDRPPAVDTIPRDVERCYLDPRVPAMPAPGYCSLDLLPFTSNLAGAALAARQGASDARNGWDFNAVSPSGAPGWFARDPLQPPGLRFQLAVTDTTSAERYGLPVASLRNSAGEFVQPDDAGLMAGLNAMVPSEVDGVLAVDPEAEGTDVYPLTLVTYAAVRAEQDEEALADYAGLLTYAAGAGQTPGLAAGQLPPGYLPLADDMRTQTLAVAEALVAQEDPGDPPGLTPNGPGGGEDPSDEDPPAGEEGGSADGSADGTDAGSDESGGPGGTGAENGVPGGNDAPDPAALSPGGGGGGGDVNGTVPPPADGAAAGGAGSADPPLVEDPTDPMALATPGEPVGPMQYALLAVLIVGLVGALGGPALLKFGPRAA